MKPDGFVLAGGHSRRMGVDKARLPFPGSWPMAVHIAEILRSVCPRVVLVRRGDPDGLPWITPEGRPLEVVREPDDGPRHPLWGVVTALSHTTTPFAVVVPCDVPHLTADVLRVLVSGLKDAAPGAVAWDGQRLHPLIGVFHRSLLGSAKNLAQNQGRVHRFAADLLPVRVPAQSVRNINAWDQTGQTDRFTALTERYAWLGPERLSRLIAGERARLLARGVRSVSRDIED